MASVRFPTTRPKWAVVLLTLYARGYGNKRPPKGTTPGHAPKPPPQWWSQLLMPFVHWRLDLGGKPEFRPQVLRGVKIPQWVWEVTEEVQKAEKKKKIVHAPPNFQQPQPPSAKFIGGSLKYLLRPGAYIYSAANLRGDFGAKAKEAGIEWVAFLKHQGNRPTSGDSELTNPAAENECRRAGLKVGAWGPPFGEPGEGRVAAETSRGYDFYICNPEAAFKLTGPQQGEVNPDRFLRADVFCHEYDTYSDLKGAVSTLIGADIHFKPFTDIGLDSLHVQCYINETGEQGAMQRALLMAQSPQHDFPGWDPLSVAITVGSYGIHQMSMEQYKPYLEQVGCTKRWNHYTGEFISDADFRTIKSMVAG